MPELGCHAPIVSAYYELSTERQIGMGMGPIPMSKVMEYLWQHGLPVWWARVISSADAFELKMQADEAKRAAKSKSA